MHFFTSVLVRTIHSDLIQLFSGSHGLRDASLLESALARPLQMQSYVSEPNVAELAAVMSWGLVKSHTFVDGNKRIALAALVTFLRWNGHKLACSEIEETAMILRHGQRDRRRGVDSQGRTHRRADLAHTLTGLTLRQVAGAP